MAVDYEALGMRVWQQRKMRKMTQGELAEKVGVSTSFIGHIERGEKKASLETLVALCNAMGLAPSTLLQDSLSDEVMKNQLQFDKNNEDLVTRMIGLVREHTDFN